MLLQIKTKQFHFMLYMLSSPTKYNYRLLSTYKSFCTMEKAINTGSASNQITLIVNNSFYDLFEMGSAATT